MHRGGWICPVLVKGMETRLTVQRTAPANDYPADSIARHTRVVKLPKVCIDISGARTTQTLTTVRWDPEYILNQSILLDLAKVIVAERKAKGAMVARPNTVRDEDVQARVKAIREVYRKAYLPASAL